ncbi:fumarylacetoacetate hydrolase family protein [Catenovulum sediminis]|uniref:Fumarylacetoacetate hydrolase family protein n=1 Tax=Catenovulum sediminis TaxID=1740262 RepID=A0ABV1RG43_9ALTE
MSNNPYQQAAECLLKRRHKDAQYDRLAENLRPQSIEDALAIHQAMIDLKGGAVGGWKCLLPPADDKVVVAPIFSDTVHSGANCSLFADNEKARLEPEIAFVLGQYLAAKDTPYTADEVKAAVKSCHMALELMQSRYQPDLPSTFAEKLADGLVNQGLYIGPEVDKNQAFELSNVQISFTQGEKVQQFDGKHPNPTASKPLVWLINFMTQRGVSFKAGQAIITGSFAGIVEVDFSSVEIEYQNLGSYQLNLSARD